MAIEIRNKKGQIADLGDDTVLNIDRFCSLFSDEDKLFQDITYPMTLPRTPTNIAFFGGGHLVDASNDLYQIEVQVSLNGTSFLRVRWNIVWRTAIFPFFCLSISVTSGTGLRKP